MASSSPGSGQLARPGDVHTIPGLKDLSRDEKLFLGTQFSISDWTRAQPGEDPSQTRKRRARVKGLVQKASLAFCKKMEVLSNLRNRRDRANSSRRKEYREAIESLKAQCAQEWDLIDGLCERGIGERGFCLEVRREIRRASQEGTQAVRHGGQPSVQASQVEAGRKEPDPVDPVEPEVEVESAMETGGSAEASQPGTAPACVTVEGPRLPVSAQSVSKAGEQVEPGREPEEAVQREAGAAGGGRAVILKPVVVLSPLLTGTQKTWKISGEETLATVEPGTVIPQGTPMSPVCVPVVQDGSDKMAAAAQTHAMGEGETRAEGLTNKTLVAFPGPAAEVVVVERDGVVDEAGSLPLQDAGEDDPQAPCVPPVANGAGAAAGVAREVGEGPGGAGLPEVPLEVVSDHFRLVSPATSGLLPGQEVGGRCGGWV